MFARVRPRIGVMKIEQKFHAGVLDAHGERHRVIQVVDAVVGTGLRLRRAAGEQPQPAAIESAVCQNLKSVTRHAVFEIDDAFRFEVSEMGHVRASNEIHCRGAVGKEATDQETERCDMAVQDPIRAAALMRQAGWYWRWFKRQSRVMLTANPFKWF